MANVAQPWETLDGRVHCPAKLLLDQSRTLDWCSWTRAGRTLVTVPDERNQNQRASIWHLDEGETAFSRRP